MFLAERRPFSFDRSVRSGMQPPADGGSPLRGFMFQRLRQHRLLLAAAPAMAGGSVEEPADKKAPQSNEAGTDNPAQAGQGPAEPEGEGAPVPKDAAKGTSPPSDTNDDKK